MVIGGPTLLRVSKRLTKSHLPHLNRCRHRATLQRRIRHGHVPSTTYEVFDRPGGATRVSASYHDPSQVILIDQPRGTRTVLIGDPPGRNNLHVALDDDQVGAQMTPARCREHHGSLAKAYLAENDPAAASTHLLESETPALAVEPLVEAARRAQAEGDLEAAHTALKHAYLSADDEEWFRRIEILEESASVLTELGEFAEAVTALEEIAELASVYGVQRR